MAHLEPVAVTRLYRMISRQIADKIQAGDFPAGSRLPAERDLAASLHVSRTTVREALIALELDGYVEIRIGAGVFVTGARPGGPGSFLRHERSGSPASGGAPEPVAALRAEDMTPFELIVVHLLVEPESAALAARNGTPDQLRAIDAATRGLGHSGSPAEQNREFHLAIAKASGNAALAATIGHLWGLRSNSVIYTKLEGHFMAEKIWQLAEAEHDDVALAIARRDPAAARRAMRAHFLAIRKRLRNDFKEENLFQDDDGAGAPAP